MTMNYVYAKFDQTSQGWFPVASTLKSIQIRR